MSVKTKYPRSVGALVGSHPTLKFLIEKSARLNELLEIVRSHLPPALAEHCHAVSEDKKSLMLYTDSSAWASRLRFTARQLQTNLRKSGYTADKIAVRVLIKRTPKKSHREKIRQLTPENAELIRQTARDIPDAALSKSLQRLCRHVEKN